ncbi:methylenetetrahydrofolate reductase [NAD(P)H] [candidate division WOR-1 bacterium RIFCSPLOWO2_12_FULL_45_9]|uniref:Methylenetetrahydrofolate reductase n=1 Tax=candidate division WOR-1 bacterium RIFCSPLOWO2_12_FULL_45_9 TaxID=1802568 RepID=A0A1F4RLL2_UNCSA|nr:MAG: methylenetetrahydrofolate reductase [NAD(P)H] [candidate division WOR-1 bacterium RIFCSPLOWO2_12_FULL_45_9]
MKVSEALDKGTPTLSFEFFPPKTEEQEAKLFKVIATLKTLKPDYVSVTYGALGNTREKTFYWVKKIKEDFGLEPVVHLTCVAAGRDEILAQIRQLQEIKIDNVLALRGDPPQGDDEFVAPAGGLAHASDLVAFIRRQVPEICLGVAGCPEKHPEATSFYSDILHLKAKVAAGADYICTQLFFDNKAFFNFREKCQKAGIKVPIIPGLMPITSFKLLTKMTEMCGATIPDDLSAKLEKNADDHEAVLKIGVEQTVRQCQELLDKGAPGLHFFVMNQSSPISEILKEVPTFSRRR